MTSASRVIPAKSIMVLDDEADIVAIFRKSLELNGYAAFAFTEPALALEHLRFNSTRYGLIISDVRMPNMSGIEFAQQVRKISTSVPIVLMSAFHFTDLQIPHDLQIAQLLEKPISASRLKELVSKYIPLIVDTKTP